MSLEMPHKNTQVLAHSWHFSMPWCAKCIFSNMFCWRILEMTSLSPFMISSSSILSSPWKFQYCCRLSGTCLRHSGHLLTITWRRANCSGSFYVSSLKNLSNLVSENCTKLWRRVLVLAHPPWGLDLTVHLQWPVPCQIGTWFSSRTWGWVQQTWQSICNDQFLARSVLDSQVVPLYAQQHALQPGWSLQLFEMNRFQWFVVWLHSERLSIQVCVEPPAAIHIS